MAGGFAPRVNAGLGWTASPAIFHKTVNNCFLPHHDPRPKYAHLILNNMDTLSRDSSSGAGNFMPMAGLFAAVIALILAVVALVKLSTVQKTVAAHDAEIPKIATLETELRAATTKSEADMKGLRDGVQNALNQVGTEIGAMRAQITKMEEAQKARAAAPAGKGAAPTGVMNPDGTYSIAAGDTLSKIAKKFGTRVDAIEAENPGIDPARLRVGQKVRIPKK